MLRFFARLPRTTPFSPARRPAPRSGQRLAALGLLVATCLPLQAHAYVLPADFLCRLLADSRRTSLRDVTLSLSATVVGEGEPVDERIYFKRPERMRQVQTGTPGRVLVSNEGLAASGTEAGLKDDGTSPNPWPALWFPRGKDLDETSARMLEAIEAVGIDASVVSLSRYAGGIAYVLGARPWEPSKPQLWLDKTTFVPVRILWPAPASAASEPAQAKDAGPQLPADHPGAGMHELRLLSYVGGIPRRIEEWEDGRLLRRSEVQSVKVNQNLPESLFALPGAGSK